MLFIDLEAFSSEPGLVYFHKLTVANSLVLQKASVNGLWFHVIINIGCFAGLGCRWPISEITIRGTNVFLNGGNSSQSAACSVFFK